MVPQQPAGRLILKRDPSTYRPEIQGLRAVAAVLVATYHIWLGRVSGGVDVFFAVSAFLVTTSLLRQVEGTGHLSPLRFWSGLAQRLLPAASLVLVAVVIASVAWLPRPLWETTLQQVVAASFQVVNWQLAFSAIDYLAQGQSAGPVQHYWAMSLQWQFYLLWPLLFLLVLGVSRRMRIPFRTLAILAVAGIVLVSLAWSIRATRVDQPFTYFDTSARLWEFGLGALVALLPASVRLPGWLRLPAGWVGLAGVVSCGLVLQVSRQFPGYAALWPVGSAVLLLLAGSSGSRFGVDRILGSRPLVQLGDLSYGLYLWHWPILVFWRWFNDHSTPSIAEGVAMLLASTALAWCTRRWLGARNRRPDPAVVRPAFARTVFAEAAPVLAVTLLWGGYFLWQKSHDAREVHVGHPDYPGALALHPANPLAVPDGIEPLPGMLAVSEDWPAIYNDGCYRPDPDWQREHCVYGDRAATRTIALVGGSHSVHWLPALDPVAREHGWRIVVYTKSNCLFSVELGRVQLDSWCEQWNARTLELLLQDRPEILVTTSTRGSGPDEHVPEGFLRRWEVVTAAGMRVIAIRDTPWMKFWVPECLEIRDASRCGQPRDRMLATHDPAREHAGRLEKVHFLDLSEYFCDERHCPPVIGNIVVYRDDSHLTAAYARTLAPLLEPRLRPWLATPVVAAARGPGS